MPVYGPVYPIPWVEKPEPYRFCEKPNYIPPPTPRNAYRSKWHDEYLIQMIDIYKIICNVMRERYPRNKIKWYTNDKIFHNLSRMLYHCSSKYIEN